MDNIIQMHASWLAVNSVRGCYNNCKYCFLQANNKNCSLPTELCSPKEAIERLINSKYYNENIPVCLLSETDPFLKENISYVENLLDEIIDKNIKNDIVLITKCYIPNFIIEKLKKLEYKGSNVIVYISYSGLKKLEPNVNYDNIKDNFINLSKANIKIIHYLRPIVPQNVDKLDDILDFVGSYTNISTITGLKLIPNFIDKISFWDDIIYNKKKALKAESVYPKNGWDYFHKDYKKNQLIYHTNICALCNKLERGSFYYNSYECKKLNICSKEQRKICKICYKSINKKEIIENCKEILDKLKIEHSNARFILNKNGLELKNINIQMKDLFYLSYILKIKVFVKTNNVSQVTYNSTINGAKPLILKGKI